MYKKPPPFPPEIAHNPKSKPVQSTYRPPLTNSAWSSSQLSTKPFWESDKDDITTTSNTLQPQPQPQQNVAPPSPPTVISSWGIQPKSDPPMTFPPPPASQQPSPNPSPQSSTTRAQRRSLGSYASRYATHPQPHTITSPADTTSSVSISHSSSTSTFTVAPALSNQPPAALAPTATTSMTDTTPVTSSKPLVVSGTISLADLLTPTLPPPATKPPLFELDIELIAGITARLPIYETDDYNVAVQDFAKSHSLTIAPAAEKMFASKVKQMVDELKILRAQDNNR